MNLNLFLKQNVSGLFNCYIAYFIAICSFVCWFNVGSIRQDRKSKISVVNHDEKATLNNKDITIGDDLVDKLKDNDKFDFQVVSEKSR